MVILETLEFGVKLIFLFAMGGLKMFLENP
jgi:hypothetical protein